MGKGLGLNVIKGSKGRWVQLATKRKKKFDQQGEKTCTCLTSKEETKICVQCAMKTKGGDQIQKSVWV
jgi:hypothetical protein